MSYDYDLVVIGSGPAGQKAAVQAAKLGKRVGVAERGQVGGVSVNTGTIPSKTLREAVVYLTGLSQRDIYGQSYRVKEEITVEDLAVRTRWVIEREVDIVRAQLARNRIEILSGTAQFPGSAHDRRAGRGRGGAARERRQHRHRLRIPARPPAQRGVRRSTILDSDSLLQLARIPTSLVVVGAGVIGTEYASMFAALGTKVTIVERRPQLLDFCDAEVVEGLRYHLRDLGVVFRLGEAVASVDPHEGTTVTTLESGKRIMAEAVLYSAGRQGATDALALENAGLEADERGRIQVDENYRTAAEHIYAVGDVIGWPSLAATSMEQGRLAASHAFDHSTKSMGGLLPFGIYTIPEISFVGKTEEELTDAAIPYEVGISRYRELARGQILGDLYGTLKLLVSPDDRRILGVHVFGTSATEVVHIGQAVMGNGGTIDYLVDSVFNYPTLAESYKVAALDAMNKLNAFARIDA